MLQLHRPSYETCIDVSMITVTFYNFDPKDNRIHNETLEPVGTYESVLSAINF